MNIEKDKCRTFAKFQLDRWGVWDEPDRSNPYLSMFKVQSLESKPINFVDDSVSDSSESGCDFIPAKS